MLESIMASLIANMLWDEIKVNKIEKKLEVIEEVVNMFNGINTATK